MKTFDEFYEKLKSENNNELQIMWQEAKKENDKQNKIAGIICGIIDAFILINLFRNGMGFGGLIFIYTLFFAVVLNIVIFGLIKGFSGKKQRTYNLKCKEIIIKKIMENFYDNLEYFPEKPMPERIYEKLNYEYFNKYKSDDYFEGQIDNKYSIQMAEILTQEEETYRDSEGRTQTRTTTKFHGLFGKIVMHKSISSELKIMRDKTILSKKRLKMDSSEFEKHFDVQASNQIIGMQILTADVMEELVQFENKTNMKFDVVIKDNELYLRFYSGAMFEFGKLKNKAIDKEAVKKYFYMLNFTYNLSKKLINVIEDTQI